MPHPLQEYLRNAYNTKHQDAERHAVAATAQKKFKLFKHHKSWRQAWRFCQRTGGNLATVRSAEENAEIVSLINGCHDGMDKSKVWIGGRKRFYCNRWRWMWVRGGRRSQYTNWSPELDHSKYRQCMHMAEGQWHSEGCSTEQSFVCEYYDGREEHYGDGCTATAEPLPAITQTFDPWVGALPQTDNVSEVNSSSEVENDFELPEGLDVRPGGFCTTDESAVTSEDFQKCELIEVGAVANGQGTWFPEYTFPPASEIKGHKVIYVNHLASDVSVYMTSDEAGFEATAGHKSCWVPVGDFWQQTDLVSCLRLLQENGLQLCSSNSFAECDVITTGNLSALPEEALDARNLADGKRVHLSSELQQRSGHILTDQPDGCWVTADTQWNAVGNGQCLRGIRLPQEEYLRLISSPQDGVASTASSADSSSSSSDTMTIGLMAAVAVLCLATVVLAVVAIMLKRKLSKVHSRANMMRTASEPYGEPNPVAGIPVDVKKDVKTVYSDTEENATAEKSAV